MEKLSEMHRYKIPVWNRHLRPGYVDKIKIPDEHPFLQLLQEGMNQYRFKAYAELSSECFLQIVPYAFPTGRVIWDFYLVSMLRCEEHDQLFQLLDELRNLNLDSFITEQDWDKRLKENLR